MKNSKNFAKTLLFSLLSVVFPLIGFMAEMQGSFLFLFGTIAACIVISDLGIPFLPYPLTLFILHTAYTLITLSVMNWTMALVSAFFPVLIILVGGLIAANKKSTIQTTP